MIGILSTSGQVVSYQFGPFRLLPDQRRLERDGMAVTLTPKAFDLLVTLVRHRARALSKDELLAAVWPGAIVEEANLAQQVLVLRRVLADAGDSIATLPRHGYRFVAPTVERHNNADPQATSPHSLSWDGRQFPLAEGITIVGRAEEADIRIALPSVSRRHARLTVSGMDATLEDLGSRHGSWRGSTLAQSPLRLRSGDELRLGAAVLVYRLSLPGDTTGD